MSSPADSIFPMDTLWEAYGLRLSRQDRVEAYENIEFAGTFFSFFLHRRTLHVVILNIFSTFCALLRSLAHARHISCMYHGYVVATWESFCSSSSELQTKRIKWFILFVRPKWGVVSHFGYLFPSWIISWQNYEIWYHYRGRQTTNKPLKLPKNCLLHLIDTKLNSVLIRNANINRRKLFLKLVLKP